MYGAYPTTQLLKRVAPVSIKMMELEKLIMEMVSQLHALIALTQVLIG
jgi:hypothetical protein